jgi:hypothetical protein
VLPPACAAAAILVVCLPFTSVPAPAPQDILRSYTAPLSGSSSQQGWEWTLAAARPWAEPAWEDYLLLLEESEYAAWWVRAGARACMRPAGRCSGWLMGLLSGRPCFSSTARLQPLRCSAAAGAQPRLGMVVVDLRA